MEDSHCRHISVSPCCFVPDFDMMIDVPNNQDDESYIDEFLDSIFNDNVRYNTEWEFVD